jgi:hypothetical protein
VVVGDVLDRQLQLSSIPSPNHINLSTPFPCGFGRIRPRLPEPLFHTVVKLVIIRTLVTMIKNDVIADTFILDQPFIILVGLL